MQQFRGTTIVSVRRNGIVAIRAVAHKLARAVFHMLKHHEPFDVDRAFG